MFCPSCGAEIKEGTQFCPECGAEISETIVPPKYSYGENIPQPTKVQTGVQPSQYKTTISAPKKKRRIGLFVGLIILLGFIVFTITAVSYWGEAKGEQSFYYFNNTPSTSESLALNIGTADINVNYNSSPMAPVIAINFGYDISGGFIKGKTLNEIYNLSWDNSSTTKTLTIYTKPGIGWIMFDRSSLNVTLRTNVTYALNIDSGTGKTDVNIPNNSILSNINVQCSTGTINFNIGNNVNFQNQTNFGTSTGSVKIMTGDNVTFASPVKMTASTGNIFLTASNANFKSYIYSETSTGSTNLNITNSTLEGNIFLEASTGDINANLYNLTYSANANWLWNVSTGKINLNLDQFNPMNGNITASLETSTGRVTINFRGDKSLLGASFSGDTGTGDISYTANAGFEVIGSTVLRTTNYPSQYNYIFDISTGTGNINVIGTNS